MAQTFFLYALVILIWGSTWFVLTFQLGVVSIELSVAYRFFLASLLFFGLLKIRHKTIAVPWRKHVYFALQGLFMYCASYLCIYQAAHYITSGINSVVFSIVIVLNVLFVALFFRRPLQFKLLVSASLGVLGVCCIFLPDILRFSIHKGHMMGIGFSFLASVFSALGNVMIDHNKGVPITQINAYSMLYGSLFSFIIALLLGRPLAFDFSAPYVLSLSYLVVIGSLLAFGCYTHLIHERGADRGGYPFVIIPLVSLLFSQIFEGFVWTPSIIAGFVLILAGNLLVVENKIRMTLQRSRTP